MLQAQSPGPDDFCVILEGINRMYTKTPISPDWGLDRHELSQTAVVHLQESSESISDCHGHPAEGPLAMTLVRVLLMFTSEPHTYVGRRPPMFISVEASFPGLSTQDCQGTIALFLMQCG